MERQIRKTKAENQMPLYSGDLYREWTLFHWLDFLLAMVECLAEWEKYICIFFLGNKVHCGFSAGVLLRDIFYRHPKYHWNEIRESPISLRLRHNKIITLSKSSLHVICERKTPTQCALECTWRQWSSFVGCMSWGSVLGFNNVQIFWRTHIHIHFKADNMFHFHRIIKMRSNTIYECELDYARC